MQTTIFEHAGVMLNVKYTMEADRIPTFHEIRVLGDDYKPTGPDLTGLLNTTLLMTKGLPFPEAETFLSAITAELYQ